jgi:hypothetical protein
MYTPTAGTAVSGTAIGSLPSQFVNPNKACVEVLFKPSGVWGGVDEYLLGGFGIANQIGIRVASGGITAYVTDSSTLYVTRYAPHTFAASSQHWIGVCSVDGSVSLYFDGSVQSTTNSGNGGTGILDANPTICLSGACVGYVNPVGTIQTIKECPQFVGGHCP